VRPTRLLVVADAGGPSLYHLGDEAMLEANLLAFRQLIGDVEFTVPSRDPAWTSRRYAVNSCYFPSIPAGHSAESWTQTMADAPDRSRLLADWLGEELRERLRQSTGLVVSGGGNLCATWPEKILERVALMEYAQELEIPVAIVGQTLGPRLTQGQRSLLAGPLQRSAWVGVREKPSAALAVALGVSAGRLHQHLDDAFFLEPLAVEDERAQDLRRERRPLILVTLDASLSAVEGEPALSVLASQLDALSEHLGAVLVFVPHVGGPDAGDALSDAVAGRALATKLRSKLLLLDLWEAREVRWLVEQAAMVVSTRYHPLIFAAAAGVAPLGIYQDEYTRTKLHGALSAAGIEGWCISLDEAKDGAFLPLAMELWSQRSAIANTLARFRAEAAIQEKRRWNEICLALRLEVQAPRKLPCPPARLTLNHEQEHDQAVAPRIISDEAWADYQRKGYLRLGRVLNARELAVLQERLDGIMLGRVRYPTLQMQLDTGGAYEDLPDPVSGHPVATLAYRKIQGLETDPLILELIRQEVFREICAWQYGRSASISVFRVMMMNKPASKGTYLPWHQDGGEVWQLDRDPLVTTWIALDPATRMNGCVQVIPGSHRLGLLSTKGSTISASDVQHYCPEDAIEYLELDAGEAVLLHNWLLHRSDTNHTGAPRRALSGCYMDARTLNTVSGNRFPVVFGKREDADSALPFLRGIREENRQLNQMAGEAQRYAHSLLDSNRCLEQMRQESERHANSLLEELRRRDGAWREAEGLIESIREENRRLREIVAESERYAESLLEESRRREDMRRESERYAESLLEDNRRREEMRLESERYALALEAELTRALGARTPAAARENGKGNSASSKTF